MTPALLIRMSTPLGFDDVAARLPARRRKHHTTPDIDGCEDAACRSLASVRPVMMTVAPWSAKARAMPGRYPNYRR